MIRCYFFSGGVHGIQLYVNRLFLQIAQAIRSLHFDVSLPHLPISRQLLDAVRALQDSRYDLFLINIGNK